MPLTHALRIQHTVAQGAGQAARDMVGSSRFGGGLWVDDAPYAHDDGRRGLLTAVDLQGFVVGCPRIRGEVLERQIALR